MFELALHLKKTVGELEETLSANEMFEWMDYLHPELKEKKKPLSEQIKETMGRFKKD